MNNPLYSYNKIISDDNWGLLEIIPNKNQSKNNFEIIKICEEEKQNEEEIKPKIPKLSDTNYHIRKNVLKGFGST